MTQFIECLECPKLGNYVDGTPITCLVSSYEQLALHLMHHNQIHNYGQSLEFFSFNLLKQIGILDKYTTWVNWNSQFRLLNWPEYDWLYELWLDSIRNTCRNLPCFECQIKRINKSMSYRLIKKEIKRRGYIRRPDRTEIPIPIENDNL